MDVVIKRFGIYLVVLDPTVGSEIQKTRPGIVISPDEMNRHLRTVIVAPLATGGQSSPCRVACTFQGKSGQIALDQLRTVDKTRLIRRLGAIDARTQPRILDVLLEMFSP